MGQICRDGYRSAGQYRSKPREVLSMNVPILGCSSMRRFSVDLLLMVQSQVVDVLQGCDDGDQMGTPCRCGRAAS